MTFALLAEAAGLPESPETRSERERVRDQRRNARACPVRPQTVALRALKRLKLEGGEPVDAWRPQTRGHCTVCPTCQEWRHGKAASSGSLSSILACGHTTSEAIAHSRPCVFVGCQHALWADVTDAGSLKLSFPHLEPGQMPPEKSCSLDVADLGGSTLDEVAEALNVTRERVRQLEENVLGKIRRRLPMLERHL